MTDTINPDAHGLSGEAIWQHIERMRIQHPLILNLTNYVVMNTTANALLALGASPVMAHAPEEQTEMAGYAGALVINIGTLDATWQKYFSASLAVARHLGKPVVLDPVGAGASRLRTQTALGLLEAGGVTVLRGNASEIMALAGAGGRPRGVDSTQDTEEAIASAIYLHQRYNCAVTISGEQDLIVTNHLIYRLEGGNAMMPLVTGLGCTASALTGAMLAVCTDLPQAAAMAMCIMAICGERASARAAGPGTLQLHFLDELYALNQATLVARFPHIPALQPSVLVA